MTRRLKRTPDFDVSLTIKNDSYIRPPRDAQRNWLLNQALKEFASDLEHLHQAAADYVPGVDFSGMSDRAQADLEDHQIMEDWQIPVMKAMAEAVVKDGDSVLEVGFGRGVASAFIQDLKPASHTIIECNDSVIKRYERWVTDYPDRKIDVVHALWQDAIGDLPQYDAILFHTYPLNEDDVMDQVLSSVTFAEHFFDTACKHLVDGGRFTYLTNEAESLSRAHQRALLERFKTIQISVEGPLDVPDDTRDSMWAKSMVIVTATK